MAFQLRMDRHAKLNDVAFRIMPIARAKTAGLPFPTRRVQHSTEQRSLLPSLLQIVHRRKHIFM